MLTIIAQKPGIVKNAAITKAGGRRNEWGHIFHDWVDMAIIRVEFTPEGHKLYLYPISTQGAEILERLKSVDRLEIFRKAAFRIEPNKILTTKEMKYVLKELGELLIPIIKSTNELMLLTAASIYGTRVALLAQKRINNNQVELNSILAAASELDPKLADRIMAEMRLAVLS